MIDKEALKQKYAEERDKRLRPDGNAQYIQIKDQWAHYLEDPYVPVTPRDPLTDHVTVAFIGGGFAGLVTGARLKEAGVDDVRIIEKGGDFGGTWYWNRYPGAQCDTASFVYMPLLEETNHMPSEKYAHAAEILEHSQRIGKQFGLYDNALFHTEVTDLEWDESRSRWIIRTNRGDEFTAQFVAMGTGPLHVPKLPGLEGIQDFKGHSFHTSRWDYGYTGGDPNGAPMDKLADKRVAIIGTGATAVQCVPHLARACKELYVFQRTPSGIDFRNDRPTDPDWAATRRPGWQEARRMKAMRGREGDPDVKAELNSLDRAEKIRRQENSNIEYMMRIHRRIEEVVHDKKTAESLKPWYMFMCKRPCFDDEYLPAFNRPNVHLVDTHGKGISEITAQGPVFEGKTYPLNVLIYATGFEVQKTGIYNKIVGRDGREINEVYADGIRTLFGVHTHGFPNLFIMGGYQASFQFNLTFMLQTQGDHIAECIKLAREKGAAEIDVKPETEEWWVQEVIAHRGKTSRNSECTPGYYNFEGEFNRRQDGNYNGGFRQYHEHMNRIRDELANHFLFA